jgi:hypothetical protein
MDPDIWVSGTEQGTRVRKEVPTSPEGLRAEYLLSRCINVNNSLRR